MPISGSNQRRVLKKEGGKIGFGGESKSKAGERGDREIDVPTVA